MAAPEPHGEPLQGLLAMQDDGHRDMMAHVDLLDRIRVSGTHCRLGQDVRRVNPEVVKLLDFPSSSKMVFSGRTALDTCVC